jgi:acyl carrier protein
MDVEDVIKEMLINDIFVEIPKDKMGEQDSLRDVLGLDSLGFVELRVLCESHFQVEIDDDQFTPEHFSTIAALSALIRRLQAAPAKIG